MFEMPPRDARCAQEFKMLNNETLSVTVLAFNLAPVLNKLNVGCDFYCL